MTDTPGENVDPAPNTADGRAAVPPVDHPGGWRAWLRAGDSVDGSDGLGPLLPRGQTLLFWATLVGVMLLALAVRVWATRWEPFRIDMGTFIAWAERMCAVGPRQFYTEGVFADYAPGYLYVLHWTALVKHTLFAGAGQGTYQALIRTPPIIADVLATGLIFLLVHRAWRTDAGLNGQGAVWPMAATFAAVSYALNPAIIWNSAVWGQVDSTFTLGMLITLTFVLRGQPEGAVIAFVIAFLIKPQAAAIAPVLVASLVILYPPRRWLAAGGLGALVMFVMLFPFFGFASFFALIQKLRDSTDTYAYTSLFAYNLWAIYDFWKPDTVSLFGSITPRIAGSLLYLIGLGYGMYLLMQGLRRRSELGFILFLFSTYFAFLPVMVLTRMHERYLYPVLPFLLVFGLLCQRRAESGFSGGHFAPRFLSVPLMMYVALTIFHTMNLYQVYEYYQNFDAGGPPRTNMLFYRIFDSAKVWSMLTLFVFTSFATLLPSWVERDPKARPDNSTSRPDSLTPVEGSASGST